MKLWLLLICLAVAAPMYAQDKPAKKDADNEEPIDPWADFEVGHATDGAYLPLSLGRDRTGLGLRSRMGFGWDSNVFKEDRHEDNAFFIDGAAYGYIGHDFGAFALGARGMIAGRLNFGEPDASMWDIKLGGYFKIPYGGGGFGTGISADVLYQQLQTYEIFGPLTRQTHLRAAGAIARAYVGYKVGGFLIFELGFTGKATDFSEEKTIDSPDSWEIGADFSVWLNFFDVIALKPWVRFDYEWFRDQLDFRTDGTLIKPEDNLQLLKLDAGVDADINLGFIRATGRVYTRRQDDSAAGLLRYWEYGVNAAIDFMMVGNVKLSGGTHLWMREYDKLEDTSEGKATLLEQHGAFWGEISWNFWEFLDLGARYRYTRRISGIDNGGYATHEVFVFLGVTF